MLLNLCDQALYCKSLTKPGFKYFQIVPAYRANARQARNVCHISLFSFMLPLVCCNVDVLIQAEPYIKAGFDSIVPTEAGWGGGLLFKALRFLLHSEADINTLTICKLIILTQLVSIL